MYLFFSPTNKNNKFSITIEPFLIFAMVNFVNAHSMFVQEKAPSDEKPEQESNLQTVIIAIFGTALMGITLLIAIHCYCEKRTQPSIPQATTPTL